MLVCTATFGPWLYNLALVPLKALCPGTDPHGSSGNLAIHRILLNSGRSNHLVAGVMFGVAAAESTLLVPVLTKGSTAMYSKSITMWPINEHFSRITSLANKFFNQYPLKFALYQKGISFRTRMVPPSGKPPGGLNVFIYHIFA